MSLQPIKLTSFQTGNIKKYIAEESNKTVINTKLILRACWPGEIRGCVQAIEEGQLATSWGSVLLFSPGSFILRYKPNEDDFAAIDENVFYATYTIETL